jgi:preprotein translocase subunit SecE
MTNTQNLKLSVNDWASWVGIALITIAAFFVTYYFQFMGPIKALIWIAWLTLTLLLGFFTSQGKQVFSFAKESKIELQKVVWPSRQETIQTTSIVMVMVTVMGFVLWGVDVGMMWMIGKITHLG